MAIIRFRALATTLGLAALVTLAACAGQTGTPAGTPPPSPSTDTTLFKTTGTFFETPTQPLHLCVGMILTSYPPQCGGRQLPVDGIAWPDIPDAEHVGDVRFSGDVDVQGTWDGSTFHVTSAKPATIPEPEPHSFGQACDTPVGVPITTPEQLASTEGVAGALPGVQMIWLSYLTEPDFEKENMGEAVLNVLITGDAAEAERTIRGQVDTAVCVAHVEGPDETAVSAAQQRLHTALGQEVLGSGITVRDARTVLEVTFLFDTPELRARADEALGPDVAPLARYEGMVRPA